MSADNWAVCPRCDSARDRELARRGAEVDAAYGKVTPEDFDVMRRDLRAFAGQRVDNTFREDYEIGVHDGVFSVDYRGHCETCDLQHSFKTEAPLVIDEKPAARSRGKGVTGR